MTCRNGVRVQGGAPSSGPWTAAKTWVEMIAGDNDDEGSPCGERPASCRSPRRWPSRGETAAAGEHGQRLLLAPCGRRSAGVVGDAFFVDHDRVHPDLTAHARRSRYSDVTDVLRPATSRASEVRPARARMPLRVLSDDGARRLARRSRYRDRERRSASAAQTRSPRRPSNIAAPGCTRAVSTASADRRR